MFTHHVEGPRAVASLDGFLDDEMLAVADNDPVQRPAYPVASKDLANTAIRHHFQPAKILDKGTSLPCMIVRWKIRLAAAKASIASLSMMPRPMMAAVASTDLSTVRG